MLWCNGAQKNKFSVRLRFCDTSSAPIVSNWIFRAEMKFFSIQFFSTLLWVRSKRLYRKRITWISSYFARIQNTSIPFQFLIWINFQFVLSIRSREFHCKLTPFGDVVSAKSPKCGQMEQNDLKMEWIFNQCARYCLHPMDSIRTCYHRK